jgi:hypothetical protein
MLTAYRSGLAIVACWLVACSSDDGAGPKASVPANAGAGGAQSGLAGSGGTAGGTTVPGTGSGGASTLSNFKKGDRLDFIAGTGDVPYSIGDNAYGIHGGGFLARSINGNTITVGNEAGKICISGTLEAVPDGNYGQYWGVEIGFNLNQAAAPSAGASPADAGADAGADAAPPVDAAAAAPDVVASWYPVGLIGFSYVIEGPTLNLVRFKSLPAGFDSSLESSVYCKELTPVSGREEDSLFTDMRQYCWHDPPTMLLPIENSLANISWQLPADVGGPRPFEWCLSDLRPILAN